MSNTISIRSLVTILAAFLLASCSSDPHIATFLNTADSLLSEKPDSALHLLETQTDQRTKWNQSQRMRYELLLADAYNKCFVDFTTDSIMCLVTNYYDQHGTTVEKVRAHYLLGCTYRDMGEAPQALQCYQNAAELADTTDRQNLRLLLKVYGQMAALFHAQNLPQDEIAIKEKQIRCAQLTNDTLEYIHAYELMTKPYHLLYDTAKVIEIIDKTHQLYLIYGDTAKAAQTYSTLIEYNVNRGQLAEARRLMEIYEKESGLFDNQGNIQFLHEIYYYIKGKYYLRCHQTDSAEYYFRRLQPYVNDENNALALYEGLMDIYQLYHNTDSIVKYCRLYASALDCQANTRRMETVHRMSQLYDYSRFQKKAEVEEVAAAKASALYQTVLTLIVLAVLVLYGVYYRYHQKKIREYALLSYNLDRAKNELATLQDELSQTKVELTEKDKLTEQVRNYEARFNALKVNEKRSALLSSDIVETFHEKSRWTKTFSKPTENEWNVLLRFFNQNMPLASNFIFGKDSLSPFEQKVCVLVLLDFKTGDIATLFNVSGQYITNSKETCNLKLFGEKSAHPLKKNLRQACREV